MNFSCIVNISKLIERSLPLIKSVYVSGYRPHELGIFNDKHPGVPIIKKALENQLRTLIDDGLEWVDY